MKRQRRRNLAQWRNKWNSAVEYNTHPGSILAKYMEWIKPTDGYANMHGPEPDTINVGVLSPQIIQLGLEHEYYCRQDGMWLSFGWSADPEKTLANITRPYAAVWHSDNTKQPREVKYPLIPDNIMANNIPADENWLHRDIGNY
jgi:hypothetical protein